MVYPGTGRRLGNWLEASRVVSVRGVCGRYLRGSPQQQKHNHFQEREKSGVSWFNLVISSLPSLPPTPVEGKIRVMTL